MFTAEQLLCVLAQAKRAVAAPGVVDTLVEAVRKHGAVDGIAEVLVSDDDDIASHPTAGMVPAQLICAFAIEMALCALDLLAKAGLVKPFDRETMAGAVSATLARIHTTYAIDQSLSGPMLALLVNNDRNGWSH